MGITGGFLVGPMLDSLVCMLEQPHHFEKASTD